MLNILSLSAKHGDIPVLHDVSLCVKDHQVTALLGVNGAGKTTLLSVICGLLPAARGTIQWGTCNLTQLTPNEILQQGIALVPEGRRVFSDLTVTENLWVGGTLLPKKELVCRTEEMFSLFPGLLARKKIPAGLLSGGEQQMLAIARALMTRPRLLLLDEPTMGLSPGMAEEVYALIQKLRRHTGIFLVEQNIRAALMLSDEAYCMASGTIILSGKSKALAKNSQVQKAYMGNASSKIFTTATPRLRA